MRKLGVLCAALTAMCASVLGAEPGAAGAEPGTAPPRGATPSAAATPAPAPAVATYLREAARARGGEEYRAVGVTRGPNGAEYHAYERAYRGLPVVGGDFVVVADASGTVLADPLAEQRALSVDPVPRVAAPRAAQIARAQLDHVDSVAEPRLVVFSPKGEQTLAYRTLVTGRSAEGTPSTLHVVVDARSGAVAAKWDEVLAGTANGHYYRGAGIDTQRGPSGYSMTDPSRTGLFCGIQGNGAVSGPDDTWGNGSGTDLETACADAYYAVQREWDMLRDWLGRDGFDGRGRAFPLFVGLDSVNAYWNGHTVNIGHSRDGLRQLSVLDLVAHEFGHSIFQYTPGGFDGLVETYALNEANGDIFGALTEHYANHPDDPPDYLFAEEADALGRGPERVMHDPSAGPRDEPNCWSTAIPSTEPHDAAGPANHWFYLVAEGSRPGGGKPASPICAGGPESVTGLGIRSAGRIWMTALLQKTSFWEYADARVATMNAATQLFPGDCAAYDAVRGAWDAVSVPRQGNEPARPSTCGTPAGGFSLGLTPASGEVDAGSSVTAQVGTTTDSGAPQAIALSASGLPAGATASFTPVSVISGERSTVDFRTAATTPAGSYRVTVSGAGAAGTRTASYTLLVRAAVPPSTCQGFETTRTGSLTAGAGAYQPDGSYFQTGASGTHRACLVGPAGADFTVQLQKWTGTSWTAVATGTRAAGGRALTYAGTAGYYRYRIASVTGAGAYTLGYDTP